MGMFKKETPRLNVKIFDGEDEELLWEIKDRDHMDIGLFFADHYLSQIVNVEMGDDSPDKIVVIVSAEFNKV